MKTSLITLGILALIAGVISLLDGFRNVPAGGAEEETREEIYEQVQVRTRISNEVKQIAEGPEGIANLKKMIAKSGLSLDVACQLGETGSVEALEPLKKALEHLDWQVRVYALIGIEHAVENGRAGAGFKQALAEPVAAMLHHDFKVGDTSVPYEAHTACWDATRILPQLDEELARKALLDPQVLRVDSPDFENVLRALNDMGVVVGDRVTSLLPELRPRALARTSPYPRFYGEILRSAALQKHPKFDELIKDALENFADSEVQERAAEAVCLSKGLPARMADELSDRCDKEGFEKLPVPLQHYMALWEWRLECDNGGVSQYFINSSGDHAVEALAAAKVMGATVDAYELEKKMQLFGAGGPSRVWRLRRALINQDDKLFAALDADLEVPKEMKQLSTQAMMSLYAAENAEVFKVKRGE